MPFALGPFCRSLKGWCAPPAPSVRSEVPSSAPAPYMRCEVHARMLFMNRDLDGAFVQLPSKQEVKQWEGLCCSTLQL